MKAFVVFHLLKESHILKVYVNEGKTLPDLQILVRYVVLLCFLYELLIFFYKVY